MTGSLYSTYTGNIIHRVVNPNKTYETVGWYQDLLCHEVSNGKRISVIRSEIQSTGRSSIGLYVSNSNNSAPNGLTVFRHFSGDSDLCYATVPNNNSYNIGYLRNIYAGTNAKTSGSSVLTNGTIYLQFE